MFGWIKAIFSGGWIKVAALIGEIISEAQRVRREDKVIEAAKAQAKLEGIEDVKKLDAIVRDARLAHSLPPESDPDNLDNSK